MKNIIYLLILNFTNLNSQTTLNEEIQLFDRYLTNHYDVGEDYFTEPTRKNHPYIALMYAYYLANNDKTELSKEILNSTETLEISYLNSLKSMVDGVILKNNGDKKEAEDAFKKAEREDNFSQNKWLRLELFRFYSGEEDYRAWSFLESALNIDPSFNAALVEKFFSLDEDANCSEIIEGLSRLPDSYKDAEALNLVGVAMINCKKFENARIVLKKSISIQENSNNCFSIAQIYHEYDQDFVKAERYYVKSIDLDPENIDAKNAYGWLKIDNAQYEEAEKIFKSLLTTSKDQEVYNQIINFYLLSSDFVAAQYFIEDSYNQNGSNFMNEGYDIILQIFKKKNYEDLSVNFRKKYSENDTEWLKNQIIFFFGEQ